MDGANLNAQAGLTQPALIGADVCHMNLHKTFCIPTVAEPGHGSYRSGQTPRSLSQRPSVRHVRQGKQRFGGTLWKCPDCHDFVHVHSNDGASGIQRATELAILNANYIAHRLQPVFPILYRGEKARVAHECILDLRSLKAELGITAEDVRKASYGLWLSRPYTLVSRNRHSDGGAHRVRRSRRAESVL